MHAYRIKFKKPCQHQKYILVHTHKPIQTQSHTHTKSMRKYISFLYVFFIIIIIIIMEKLQTT